MTKGQETIWHPGTDELTNSSVARFARQIEKEHGVSLPDYQALWAWSVEDVGRFWESVWSHFGISSPTSWERPLSGAMPTASWFAGASVNYCEQVFRNRDEGNPAVVVMAEDEVPREIGWDELEAQVASLAETFRGIGVRPGDRVVAYLTNRLEALVGLLVSAATGAVWTVCSPDFGVGSAIARLDVGPTVLLAADRYRYGGQVHHRAEEVTKLIEEIRPEFVIEVGDATMDPGSNGDLEVLSWSDAVSRPADLVCEQIPFEAPLWILYSSGTTGSPKGIVHSHGGIVLEHLKALSLGTDLGPGDRFYFYSSTSWMVWNYLVGGLLVGATPVLYEGSPGYPDLMGSWRVASESRATVVGLGAGYLSACEQAECDPYDRFDLAAVRTVVATGSPLPASAWDWFEDRIPASVRLACASGGTDVCSTLAGGSPLLPVRKGELSGPNLGADLQSWDPEGGPVVDEVGELVVVSPMPSMPIFFWNDPQGARYRESYFSTFTGTWCHGDWVRIGSRGAVIIEGRSDATLNRSGVRMGSADIYAVVESVEGVADSLVVGVELPDAEYFMPLFVVIEPGEDLQEVKGRIIASIRSELSPRHVPDEILLTEDVPRTLTGK